MLENWLMPQLKEDSNDYIFQQDGSPAHYKDVHFETYAVHTLTNALFINLFRSFKFTLKYTIISLLHVSVFNDHHQGA